MPDTGNFDGLDALQTMGAILFISPVIPGIVLLIMSAFSGNTNLGVDGATYALGSIETAGIITILYVSAKRFTQGRKEVR